MKKLSIYVMLLSLAIVSCKKEEKSSTPTPTTSTPPTSPLVGKWYAPIAATDSYVIDTIYIYESSGLFYITAPQIGSMTTDTMGINVSGNSFVIPAQILYSTVSLEGDGDLVLTNQLNLNWTTSPPANTVYTDVIYIRQ